MAHREGSDRVTEVTVGATYLHRGMLVTVRSRVGHHPTRGPLYGARIGTAGYVNAFADELEGVES